MAGIDLLTGSIKGEVVAVTSAGVSHPIPADALGAGSLIVSNDYDGTEASVFCFIGKAGESISGENGLFLANSATVMLDLDSGSNTHVYLISTGNVDVHLSYLSN